jgi:hypothetical protein
MDMEKQMSDPDTRIVLHRHGVKISKIEDQLEKVMKQITKILVSLENLNAKASLYDPE